jgi:mannose-6-phosphate isomerase-like protein (cupin superfamily)
MKKKTLRFGQGFRVMSGNSRSEAAEMVIPPGESEGDERNRHRGADQWLFVLEGAGVAIVDGRRCALKKNVLLLIEKGEPHEVRNNGTTLLRTLNFYVPPAYTKTGTTLPRGKG